MLLPHGQFKVLTITLVEGVVQAIDEGSGAVVSTARGGNRPNGITWVHSGGVMP